MITPITEVAVRVFRSMIQKNKKAKIQIDFLNMGTYENCTLITDMITPITDSGNPVKKE